MNFQRVVDAGWERLLMVPDENQGADQVLKNLR
jgi:hypothetical protein